MGLNPPFPKSIKPYDNRSLSHDPALRNDSEHGVTTLFECCFVSLMGSIKECRLEGIWSNQMVSCSTKSKFVCDRTCSGGIGNHLC